jgi:DNA (cytosine-5)-methyltransferase 1
MNYYNEFDPYAAQWLRNLIEAGHLPQGEVDTRSIKDVSASDLTGFVQCHFFAGLGGWSHALRLAGWPDDRPVWTGSCPCQPFSAAGTQKGTADDRHLWPVWFNLIRECRPGVVFGEQVEAAINHGWLDLVQSDLESEGYACGAAGIPAAGVGAPHIRQRLWFVADTQSVGRSVQHTPHDGSANAPSNTFANANDSVADQRRPYVSQLADSQCEGLEGHIGDGNDSNKPGRVNAQPPRPIAPSSWSDCDWLPCRDGKSRPVEPSTFPLAHGAAARVGRLRAYGNAIVPQVAQVFIEAYLES